MHRTGLWVISLHMIPIFPQAVSPSTTPDNSLLSLLVPYSPNSAAVPEHEPVKPPYLATGKAERMMPQPCGTQVGITQMFTSNSVSI